MITVYFSHMLEKILKYNILKNFFLINLSNKERQIAIESIKDKYVPSIRNSFLFTLLCVPSILVLDMSIVVSVLIPITMVSGTAWFAVSLANMKKKFESFGTELTVDLFESFVTSLLLLFLIALVAINPGLFSLIKTHLDYNILYIIAGILATIVIGRISLKIFLGALKYDINDAMLSGQAEAAERFYKKSLSFLHQSALSLKSGKSLEVANYHIANAFFELFSYIKSKIKSQNLKQEELDALITHAETLKKIPNNNQEKIDQISVELIERFLGYCIGATDPDSQKSIHNINLELECIKDGRRNESQQLTDTRFASIFQEIAELIEEQGESLFISPTK